MVLLKFLQDRTVFVVMFLTYALWRNTWGPVAWQALYARYTDFELIVVGTLFVSILAYVVFGLLTGIIDLLLFPNGVSPGPRLQPKNPPTWHFYFKALPVVVFNFLILGLPTAYFAYYFAHPASPRNATPKGSPLRLYSTLPLTTTVLRDVVVSVLIEEVLFYYLHRLFHHPSLYATFHKKHHEFTAPIGMAAVYTTPLDFIITNLMPLLIGPLVLNSHPIAIWFYFAEAIINTVITHSGYTLPGLPNANMHDFHHETFNNMFGVIGLMDYLHGTDLKFRERYAPSSTAPPMKKVQ